MKRWLVRICVFLLLGAIVNVAVAWGCVLAGRVAPAGVANASSMWDWIAAEGWSPLPDRDLITHKKEVRILDGHGVTLWCYFECEQPKDMWNSPSMLYVRCSAQMTTGGWPLRCMMGRVMSRDMVSRSDIRGSYYSLRMSDDSPILPGATGSGLYVKYFIFGGREYGGRHLPLVPIWPGFAINTVFYAVVLWLLFAGPFVVRRWRRIRRGLCPKCAYDLRGTPADATACPECGAARSLPPNTVQN